MSQETGAKDMAGIILPERSLLTEYHGLDAIFEYTNEDGEMCLHNCGQAAAATLLACHGKLTRLEERALGQMHGLENRFPPDVLGGRLGTTRGCVERICRAYGVPVIEIDGEAALRRELGRRNPVAVMLGVPSHKLWRFNLPGGHWVVAYGYDPECVHVTNWGGGKMPWPEFRRRWRSVVALLIQMRLRGLAAAHPPGDI